MHGPIQPQDVLVERRAVDGWIELDLGDAGAEVDDLLDPIRADLRDGPPHSELLLDVPEKPLVPRDHDLRGPRLGLDPEEPELDRQRGRILHRLRDIGVHSLHEGPDDLRPTVVVMTHLIVHVAAELEQPCPDVPLSQPSVVPELAEEPRKLSVHPGVLGLGSHGPGTIARTACDTI